MHTLTLAQACRIAAQILDHVDAGSLAQAVALGEAELAHATGEARAVIQHARAIALNGAGRAMDALRAAGDARQGFKTAGNESGELDALLALGAVLRAAGDHASAIQSFEEAEPITRRLADDARLGIVLRQIGICCSLLGRHHQALSSLEEAAALHARASVVREHLSTLLSLYNAESRRAAALPHDSDERRAILARHLVQWRELGARAAGAGQVRTELMALGNHAITLHDFGCSRDALAALASLLGRYREHGMTPNVAITHFEMGRAHQALAQSQAARDCFLQAIAIFEPSGASKDLRDALEALADAEEALGDHRAALSALRRAQAIRNRTDDEGARRSAAQRELRIELARLSSQWHKLASIDPLTGLANRRALDQWFDEVQPRIDLGEPMTLLLHDMDHFKSINDRFGHGVGDDVLRQVATLIHANCRPSDLAVRYGGEEFILAMMGVDHIRAIDVAERLRVSVQNHAWWGIAPELQVTISVGIAAATETDDPAALLTLADRRLYAAKHGGRNRVVHSG